MPENPRRTGSNFQHTFAALAVVLFAGVAADLVLWPRDGLPPVADVPVSRYFSAAFVDRADAFRGPQAWLGMIGALVLIAVPLACALRWPVAVAGGRLSRWADRRSGVVLGRGGALRAALAAAVVAGLALVATLPFDFIAYRRAHDVGLSVQGVPGWLWSWLLATLLTLLGVALLAMLALFLVRKLGRAWWAAFGGALIALAFLLQAVAPVVIAPMFADFEKLPAGPVRAEVEKLARTSGVDAGAIYVVDAGKRTTGANAYVAGLGSTKRVVLYDTLLDDFPPGERRNVVAHELGHAHHNDLIAGLVWFSFVCLVSLFAVDLLARVLADRRDVELASPAGVAMILSAVLVAVAVSQPAANAYSRQVEARADAFALKATKDPDAAIALDRRLTVNNVSRPDPPSWQAFLFGTHPKPIDRIGMAVTVKRELER